MGYSTTTIETIRAMALRGEKIPSPMILQMCSDIDQLLNALIEISKHKDEYGLGTEPAQMAKFALDKVLN